jgi:large subunit ribosomal protein L17
MRHGKRFNHLSRTSAHRKAMLANMASSLIIHKRIKTTVAKAKALRMYIEPLITKSKTDSTHSRRVIFSYLNDKEAVTELFREVAVKVADRPGGYTRIIKIGARLGDNAEIALIELVDYNENLLDTKAKGPKKSRRRRGGAKQAEDGVVVADQAAETAEEVVEDAVEEVTEEKTEEVKEEEAAEEKPKAEEIVEEVKDEVVAEEEPKVEEAAEEVKEEAEAAEKEEPKAEEIVEEVKEEVVDEEEPKVEEAVEEVKEEAEAEEKEEEKEEPKAEEKDEKKEKKDENK